jgi:LysR family transcriptional regulator (chromosome initiation inhibitor)
MIDHRLLAFEAVLQEGSFERAARRLALTQSAVSQRVKLLEAEYGQVLLVRSKPARPTPAGRRLLPYLAQLRLMEAEARRALEPGREHRPASACGRCQCRLARHLVRQRGEPTVVREENLVLDCVVDDQDHTHALLADGEVLGCVSTATRSDTRLRRPAPRAPCPTCVPAQPEFRARWFPRRAEPHAALVAAPAIVFGRHDDMHEEFLQPPLRPRCPTAILTTSCPPSESFMAFALAGLGYGFIPEVQARRTSGPRRAGRS